MKRWDRSGKSRLKTPLINADIVLVNAAPANFFTLTEWLFASGIGNLKLVHKIAHGLSRMRGIDNSSFD